MPKTAEQQIAEIEKQLPTLESKLAKVKKWAMADGQISADEQATIDRIEQKIAELRRKRESLGTAGAAAAGDGADLEKELAALETELGDILSELA